MISSYRFAVFFISTVACLLAGCGPLPMSASIQASELCKTFPAVVVPGDPAGGSGTFDTDTTVDLSSELSSLSEQGLSMNLDVTLITVTSVSGVQDFGFLDSAQIDVITSSGPISLVGYARDPAVASPTGLILTPPAGIDLANAIEDGQAHLVVHISGALPTADWSVAVKACFDVSGRLAQ